MLAHGRLVAGSSKTETEAREPDAEDKRQRRRRRDGENGGGERSRPEAGDPPRRAGVRNRDGDCGEGESAECEARRDSGGDCDRCLHHALRSGNVQLSRNALPERELGSP